MTITFDLTILVRAFGEIAGSAGELLLKIWDGDHVVVLSSEILAETSKVLRYPRLRFFERAKELALAARDAGTRVYDR